MRQGGMGGGGMSRGYGGAPMGQPNPWGQSQPRSAITPGDGSFYYGDPMRNMNMGSEVGMPSSRFGGDPMASMPRPGQNAPYTRSPMTPDVQAPVGTKPGLGYNSGGIPQGQPFTRSPMTPDMPPGYAKGQDPYGQTTGGNPQMSFQQFMSQFYGQR